MTAFLALLLCAAPTPAVEKGTVRVECPADATVGVPERYRLPACSFDFTLSPRVKLRHSGVDTFDLTFPSPVKSGVGRNDTVHAEFFVPAERNGKVPAVIVLDIMDGAGVVSRGQALWLAQSGVAALVVHMPYYGPRREPGSKMRLVSTDLARTVEGVRQLVLDCRCATAWLASRPEVDADKLGLVGTSLGSLMGANVAAAEPRLKSVCLLLTGGGLYDAYAEHPLAKPYLTVLGAVGGTKAIKNAIAPVDPITHGPALKAKSLLIVAASRDEVVPPRAAQALWEASGKQKLVWLDATHVGSAVFVFPMMKEVVSHLKGSP
jgi:dienelactone hydrolase